MTDHFTAPMRPPLYFFNYPNAIGGAGTKVSHLLRLLHQDYAITMVPNRAESLADASWRRFLAGLGVRALTWRQLPRKLSGWGLSLCNSCFFNGEVLDDRVPATCKIKVRADELKATFAPLLLYTHGATFSENFFNNWTTATTANPNAGTWTVAMSNRRSHLFNAAPTPASNISFRTHALWPATEPVTFAQHGGVVSPGYSLTIATNATVPAGSTVYYTTDGTEPRVWGGSVAAGDSSYVTTASPTSFQITVPGVLYTTVKARVRNGTTSEWSALTEATYQFAAVPATAANLVVSQIMYNPPDTTAAEEAAGFTDRDDFEYIELRNIAAVPVSLDNVKLIAGVSFDFATSVVSSPVRALAPGGTVLIVRNKPAFRQRYGNSLDAKIAGSYLGNLSNSGERLWITGPDGADADTNADTIKDFSYNDDSGWPEVADGHGSALRLLNPAANPDHALPASWAATLQWAGTPGALVIPVTFATWLDGHFNAASLADPLITGPNADPDNDGLGNLIEFVRGTIPDRPTANALAGLPTYTIASGPDTLDHLFAAWTVNAQTLATVTIVAEAGNDLTVWTPLTALPVVTNADGTATLTFRDETGRKSNPRRYVRFRVTSL